MHREIRLRQLNGKLLVPILAELAHTVTLMAYDSLASAWQGQGGRRNPMQLLVLTGGMMSLQAVLFDDGFTHMMKPPPAPPTRVFSTSSSAMLQMPTL